MPSGAEFARAAVWSEVESAGAAVGSEVESAGAAVGSEVESAGAAVAVGEQAGQRGDGDLGRDPGADVEPDRPVHASDLVRRDAESGEHGHVRPDVPRVAHDPDPPGDRKSTRLNSSHDQISYAVFCLK